MKDQATKILIIISFLIVFISFENVNAITNPITVTSSNNRQTICAVENEIKVGANGFVFEISSAGKNVKPNLILDNDISDDKLKNCFCNNFDGVCTKKGNKGTLLCAPENSFNATNATQSCAISQVNNDGTYEYKICSNEDYSAATTALKNSMTQTMNDDGTYTITLKMPSQYKEYAGNIYIEYCNQNNCNIDPKTGLPQYSERKISSNNGTYSIKLKAGIDYYLVFKGNIDGANGVCKSSYLGYYQGLIPTTVKNTLYNSDICTNMRKMFPKKSDSWMTGLLSDCYSDTISNSRLAQFSEEINSKWTMLQNILNNTTSGGSSSTSNNNFICQFDENKNKHSEAVATYTQVLKEGTYWSAMCTEELYLEYDTPKAVSAGSSFDYNATVTVKRTCQPIQVSKPVYKDTCEYGVECWGGPAQHTGEPGAGPNDEFDSCINTCDNGKYTQKCINSCYQQVYKNKTTSNSSIKFQNTLTLNNYKAKFISLIGSTKANGGNKYTLNPVSSECVIAGNVNSNWYQNNPDISKCGIKCEDDVINDYQYCITEHGIGFTYLNGCNGNENSEATMCYEVYKSSMDCSSNAFGEYQQALEASYNEYRDILTRIQEVNTENLKNEKYTMSIFERYNDNDTLTTIFDNKSGNNKIYSKEEDKGNLNKDSGAMVSIADQIVDGLTPDQVNWIQNGLSTDSYTLTRTINLKIGAAYVTRDGSAANDSGTLPSSQNVTYNRTNNLTDTNKDNNSLYYGPYNRYFTSLYTQLGINDYKSWPDYNQESINKSTDEYEKNITISLENIGTWNQWGKTINSSSESINVQCFYGTTTDGCGWLCPKDKGGIQYIFRPINLSDIFPNNRNPRFNWTGTVKNNTATGAAISKLSNQSRYQNYEDVNPEGLIRAIESKNESIYNVTTNSSEIDYEFVLTKENIRNIRNYNKNIRDYNHDGDKNYLDYNMSCYKNNRGQEICTSKFMDNINGNAGNDSSGNFITYSVNGYGIVQRKSIAGCNNAINGSACDTSLFGSY